MIRITKSSKRRSGQIFAETKINETNRTNLARKKKIRKMIRSGEKFSYGHEKSNHGARAPPDHTMPDHARPLGRRGGKVGFTEPVPLSSLLLQQLLKKNPLERTKPLKRLTSSTFFHIVHFCPNSRANMISRPNSLMQGFGAPSYQPLPSPEVSGQSVSVLCRCQSSKPPFACDTQLCARPRAACHFE